jgi:hypothetical protein
VRLLLAGRRGDLVTDGLVEQRAKRGLPDLLEGGQLHASHREPARSLPASSVGQQTLWIRKLTAVIEAECDVLLEGHQVGELLAERFTLSRGN